MVFILWEMVVFLSKMWLYFLLRLMEYFNCLIVCVVIILWMCKMLRCEMVVIILVYVMFWWLNIIEFVMWIIIVESLGFLIK